MLESNWKNKSKSKWQCSGDKGEVTIQNIQAIVVNIPPHCNFAGCRSYSSFKSGSTSRRTILLDWLVVGLNCQGRQSLLLWMSASECLLLLKASGVTQGGHSQSAKELWDIRRSRTPNLMKKGFAKNTNDINPKKS